MTSAPLVPFRVSLPVVPVVVHPCALPTVVVSASVLLFGVGSVSVAVVAAVAVIEPVACGSRVIVTVAEALVARFPIVQVTVGAVIEQLPWVVVAETIVRARPESVTVVLTAVAAAGPLLVTVVV